MLLRQRNTSKNPPRSKMCSQRTHDPQSIYGHRDPSLVKISEYLHMREQQGGPTKANLAIPASASLYDLTPPPVGSPQLAIGQPNFVTARELL
jgi:hypothetical protein